MSTLRYPGFKPRPSIRFPLQDGLTHTDVIARCQANFMLKLLIIEICTFTARIGQGITISISSNPGVFS